MASQQFRYNQNAHYESRAYKWKAIDLVNQTTVITSDGKGFKSSYPNIFEKYVLPYVESDTLVKRWNSDSMLFWQNQLNFAVWCATSGCGVDYKNHLNADAMIGSLFKFHVYYQIRRILFELGIALPTDQSWNAFNNQYDRSAYERICAEFEVDPYTDWRQKLSFNNGLGSIYHYWVSRHQYELIGNKPDYVYNSKQMSFTDYSGKSGMHIDYIAQGKEANDAWSTFILDESDGFTKAGVERINDSIRTYCWAILGSQSQTRTDILGSGTAFDAQKQFLANIEDVISSPVDLPSQIVRYQNTLKYARSKVDFVYGIGLYMSPSDMELQIGTIKDYNNEIVIATDQQELGLNNNVNAKAVPTKITQPIQGTSTKPPKQNVTNRTPEEIEYNTDIKDIIAYSQKNNMPTTWVWWAKNHQSQARDQIKTGNSNAYHNFMKSQGLEDPVKPVQHTVQQPVQTVQPVQPVQQAQPLQSQTHDDHENNKTALIIGSVVVGSTLIYLYR